jgi:hypothetical protein
MNILIIFNIMFTLTFINNFLYKPQVSSLLIPLSKRSHFLSPSKNAKFKQQFESSSQIYFLKKSNMLFSHDQSDIYIQKNEFIKNKKIISIQYSIMELTLIYKK